MALKLGTQREWVKNIAKNQLVVPHIDRAVDQLGDFEFETGFGPKPKDDAWHPSGDCTPSLNELYLKAIGEAPPWDISAKLRKIFTVGHFWHGYLQEVLVQAELVEAADIERRGMVGWGDTEELRTFDHIESPIPWQPWHWVTGSIDVARFDVPRRGPVVLDFKTMNPRHFALEEAPDSYADKWECQLNIYMDWTDLEEAFIIGVDKTAGELKEFRYERNQELIDALYNKWELVAACVVEGIEPPEDEEFPLPLKGHK